MQNRKPHWGRIAAACLAAALTASGAAHAQSPHFVNLVTPQGVPGERTVSIDVALKGASPQNVYTYLAYGRTPAERDQVARSARAACRAVPGNADMRRCSVVLPFPGNTNPYDAHRNPHVAAAGETVHIQWCKQITLAGAAERLTICDERAQFVMPRPFTIAVIGDSYASGEGAPARSITEIRAEDVPGARSGENTLMWSHARCHRSTKSGHRQGIVAFQRANPDLYVERANFACSGAVIFSLDGENPALLTPGRQPDNWGPLDPVVHEPPQVDAAAAWIARPEIGGSLDVLVVSIGGNDMGFGDVVMDCLIGKLLGCQGDQEVLTYINGGLTQLRANYDALAERIRNDLKPRRVYITDYPDPTRNSRGEWCGGIPEGVCYGPLEMSLRPEEAEFAFEQALLPLNATVRAGAAANGWTVLGGHPEVTRTRGLCNCRSETFNTVLTSMVIQGDPWGAVHMHDNGQEDVYRESVKDALQRDWAARSARQVPLNLPRIGVAAPRLRIPPELALVDLDDDLRGVATDPRNVRPRVTLAAQPIQLPPAVAERLRARAAQRKAIQSRLENPRIPPELRQHYRLQTPTLRPALPPRQVLPPR